MREFRRGITRVQCDYTNYVFLSKYVNFLLPRKFRDSVQENKVSGFRVFLYLQTRGRRKSERYKTIENIYSELQKAYGSPVKKKDLVRKGEKVIKKVAASAFMISESDQDNCLSVDSDCTFTAEMSWVWRRRVINASTDGTWGIDSEVLDHLNIKPKHTPVDKSPY